MGRAARCVAALAAACLGVAGAVRGVRAAPRLASVGSVQQPPLGFVAGIEGLYRTIHSLQRRNITAKATRDEPCKAVCGADAGSPACTETCARVRTALCSGSCTKLCGAGGGDCQKDCLELQPLLCGGKVIAEAPQIEEAVLEELPEMAAETVDTQPIKDSIQDDPEPIDPASEPDVWADAKRHASSALEILNAQRLKLGMGKINGAKMEVLHAWVQIEDTESFKICMRLDLQGQAEYVTVDTSSRPGPLETAQPAAMTPPPPDPVAGDGAAQATPRSSPTASPPCAQPENGPDDNIVITGLHPFGLVLGEEYAHEESLKLEKLESVSLEDDPVTQGKYPCSADFASLLSTSRPMLGERRMVSASLLGRSYRHLRRQGVNASDDRLPAAFNSREEWSQCALPVRDQGQCGACYSFATAAVVGERLCIAKVEGDKMAAGQLDGIRAESWKSDEEEEMKQLQAELSGVKDESQALVRKIKSVTDRFASAKKRFLAAGPAAAGPAEAGPAQTGPAAAGAAAFAQRNSTALARGKEPGEMAAFGWSRSSIAVPLSTQELVSCGSADRASLRTPYCVRGPGGRKDRRYSYGCEGATSFSSLFWVHRYGLPTKECTPYVSGGGSYEQHFAWAAGKVPKCSSLERKPCHAERQQHRTEQPERIMDGDVESIMRVLYTSGPVYANLAVHGDFMKYRPYNYPDKIYYWDARSPKLGFHALILDGWGVGERTGVPFWHGRNSWSTHWGIDGLFRMRRGTNEVGIEDGVHFARSLGAGVVAPDFAVFAGMGCIAVRQSGGTCSFVNTCSDVRTVRFTYMGTEENCGSWGARISRLYPGERHKHVVHNAYACTVTEDSFVQAWDSTMYYEEVTADFPDSGRQCLLKNAFQGTGQRKRCCGEHCAHADPGKVASFPAYLCEEGCRKDYGMEVIETTVPI